MEAKQKESCEADAGTGRVSCFKGFRATGHWKCWMITTVLWGLLVPGIHCHVKMEEFCPWYGSTECDPPCGFFIGRFSHFFWVCLVFAFLLYFLEFAFSSSRKYLANTVDNLVLLYDILNTLKDESPSIWMKVENYHYEIRTQTVSVVTMSTQTYEERVVTSTFQENYQFNVQRSRDVSQSFDGLDEYKVTKLTVDKTFTFGNDETRKNWRQVTEKFQRDHKKDVYQSFYYGMEIDGYRPKYLCELEKGVKPAWVSGTWLYVFTFLLLSPFYRTAVSSVVGRKSYQLIKEIYV